MTLRILLEDEIRFIPAQEGQTVFEALRNAAGLTVQSPCGGHGTCQKCTVYHCVDGVEMPILACQTLAQDGMTIRLPSVAPLSVELGREEPPPVVPDAGLTGFGIACDLGTTTVVCELIDLKSGKKLASLGEGNAQRAYGGDVISRIQASMEGLQPALTDTVRRQLNRMLHRLCEAQNLAPDQIQTMAVAGNPTMCHLLAGLSPNGIGTAPFTPLSRFGEEYPARTLGLPFDGSVYILPAVSGYVGGDITAGVLAANLEQMPKPSLLLDVGTNGELVLGCGKRFLCCATAAGPAFEGAQISCGMAAAPGAISSVEYHHNILSCSVIGGGAGIGLCGSGLMDAVAVMLDLGALEESGHMLHIEEDEIPDSCVPYLFLHQGEPAFRLTEQVWVTQSDVRKLQLGKGAIAAGIAVLLQTWKLRYEEVGELLLAGGFGNYLRPESAARIGLIPKELLPVTRGLGNTAVRGAWIALLSQKARQQLDFLREHMDYLELSGLSQFNDAYLDGMMFPC